MKRTIAILLPFLLTTALFIQLTVHAAVEEETAVYLPLIIGGNISPPTEPLIEFRGVWVSRFDWTNYGEAADPAKIDEIVNNVAAAGFNVIFFQVRGIADSYYTPGVEPWADRVSGVYGQAPDPLWDPLETMVEKAHAANIQVHAYINVYPVWNGGGFCDDPPANSVAPTPFYHQLIAEHGTTNDKPNGFIWNINEDVQCDTYIRATPASIFVNDHLIAVGTDLVTRYDIDGLHLDHIRYSGNDGSCDPVSAARYGANCFADAGYAEWQRQQISGTVRRFYEEVVPLKEGLWLSAAVWPIHINKSEWNFPGTPQQGYFDYYQDSKAWVTEGIIDTISPMIYPGSGINCPDDSYWQLDRWQTLVADFEAEANGRFIIPGIGTDYCTFDEIESRITLARAIGTAGHALFSYSGLLSNDYFDELANGPYAETAVVPQISWHP